MAEYELSEHEVDLINYLRGYTEEGDAIPNGWRLIADHKGGRWYVETRHGFSGSTLVGESGSSFSDAWTDQTSGDLRYFVGEEVASGSINAPSKPRPRPRLMVIRGGVE